MHGNYRPVFRNYRDWSLIPAALLARGLGEADVSKIMGENFLRIFDAALAHTPGPRESSTAGTGTTLRRHDSHGRGVF